MRKHPELIPVGNVLRAARKAAGYSQDKLAQASGLDLGFIGGVERGERNLGFRKLRQLVAALNVSWRDFGAALERADIDHQRPQQIRVLRRA